MTAQGDPRFDPFRSSVLAHLDEKDTLWSMHIRAELGTDRDACLVSTVELEADKQRAYVASTSVEDALVPVSAAVDVIAGRLLMLIFA